MIKIVHIISGLSSGGAEMMLYKLLTKCDRSLFQPMVISLTDNGTFGKKIQDLDIPVEVMGMRRGIPNPLAVFKLSRMLQKMQPQVIQTWMYHADLLGSLAAKIAGNIPTVWGIHNTTLSSKHSKKTTILTSRLCGILSQFLPSRIICVSEVGRDVHIALGYSPDKFIIIPNGFNLDEFNSDSEARLSFRKELGILEESLLIGLIARFDPQKDHRNFINAAALLQGKVPNAHFLLCGHGVDMQNEELVKWIQPLNYSQNFHLLGLRADIPRVMNALDILTSSSSYGEAFPLVVGEAMACGIPCAVTDVGDSALLVGDTGKVVTARDPQSLANAWSELISMGAERRRELGQKARKRICDNFSLDVVIRQYETLYEQLAEQKGRN
jgi:glycosyltransferase involved in cell wall biosynthesis